MNATARRPTATRASTPRAMTPSAARRVAAMGARFLAVLLLLSGCSRAGVSEGGGDVVTGPAAPVARIVFARDGHTVRAMSLADMERVTPAETVSGFDPYYQRVKRFRGVRLEPIVAAAFGSTTGGEPLARQQFVLRAQDGYTLPVAGDRLLEPGAFLAFADLDAPGWEPIGPQRANPGPFYLIWSNPGQIDLESHPRPWQLVSIEIAAFETVFPHTAPAGLPESDPARRGFTLFRENCLRCHAINREGGRVGPELNVPLSIVEYRPEAQIRAYVRNPLAFRYGNMPAHPNLTDGDLDALIAYFRAMSARKHDPDRPVDAGAPAVPGAVPGDAGGGP